MDWKKIFTLTPVNGIYTLVALLIPTIIQGALTPKYALMGIPIPFYAIHGQCIGLYCYTIIWWALVVDIVIWYAIISLAIFLLPKKQH